MAVKFLNGIDVDGSMNIAASDVPNLDASKITSGTFSADRIPTGLYQPAGDYLDLETANTTFQPLGNYLTSVPSEYLTQTEGDARYLKLSGGSITGDVTITSGDHALWAIDNGTGTSWRGRIGHKNSSADTSSFLGSYNSRAGVFAHNYALNAWDDLYVNTVDGTNGGNVRLPSMTYVAGNLVATQSWVSGQGYLTSIPSTYATDAEVSTAVGAVDARINEEVIPYVDAVAADASKGVTAYGWGNHASAGYLTSLPSHTHNKIVENDAITYGQGSLQWTDVSGLGGTGYAGSTLANPFNDWHHHILMNHANSSGYYVDMAYSFHNDRVHFRRKAGGGDSNLGTWREFWHTGNLSKSEFDSAGSAAAVSNALNARIDTEVFGAIGDVAGTIPTNNNQLTNGAGYITSADGGNADTVDGYQASQLWRRTGATNATVGGGWVTVAHAGQGGRWSGEVIVTDGESGDHSFIRIHWMRSYQDSNFTVLNCGGHANRITGARVLYQTSDSTYGWKYLQVYVTTSSNYYVRITQEGDTPNFSTITAVTPVVENTKSGYAVHGSELTGLENASLAAEEGIKVGGTVYTNSHGDSSQWNTAYGWGDHASAGYATTGYVDTAVSNLVDTAPAALNTLNELAAALGDDANFSTTVANNIGAIDARINEEVIPYVDAVAADAAKGVTAYGWGNHAGLYLGATAKAADSNLLDGINSTSFLRSDQSDTMSGTLTITGSNGVSRLRIEGTTPTIDLDDADGDSFYIHVNSNNFYVLADRDGGGDYGTWEVPHPLQLEADTNSAYVFGNKLQSAAYAATTAFDSAGSAEAVSTALNERIDTEVFDAIGAVAGDAAKGVTAYSWGNHASAGYLTSLPAHNHDTLYDSLGSANAVALQVNDRIDTEVFDAIATVNGNIPTNNNQLTNGAGYITAVPSSFSTNSITIGSGVTLTESTDRADLLMIKSSTSTWGGLQISNTSNEIIFSMMGDGNVIGLYDDLNNDWIIQRDENGSMRFYANASNTVTVTTSGLSVTGAITASGDVTAFSDARVKENVETISNALESVKQMRGVTYNKIGKDKQSIGVIAQEVEDVLPQLVHTDEEGMKSVAYGNITAVLIEALKEQQAQIEELKARLDGLTK